ncbi:MAG TPA: phytase [Sphingomonadaceae bacterium]|nr:phytase [Sphingomonadaceae bacterium]
MRKANALLALATALAACNQSSESETAAGPWPAVSVTAAGETEPVGTGNGEDAADDPAIWRNPESPVASLIVGTDKKAGLHVYTLDGVSRFFDPGGHLNNVDLVDLGEQGVIVVASDRNDLEAAQLRIYRLDTDTPALELLGSVPGGAGEAYGICLLVAEDGLHAFSVLKEGVIEDVRITLGATVSGAVVRTLKVPSQPEGCVADTRNGDLYIGEEVGGIWRFAAGASEGQLLAKADGKMLVADVEGLALLPEGDNGGLLVASSQGDNAFAVFRLPGLDPVGRFRIAAGEFGSTEETDGIALSMGDFGAKYPAGLFVAQDGVNGDKAQNFKLVSWQAIEEALAQWTMPEAQ